MRMAPAARVMVSVAPNDCAAAGAARPSTRIVIQPSRAGAIRGLDAGTAAGVLLYDDIPAFAHSTGPLHALRVEPRRARKGRRCESCSADSVDDRRRAR